MHSVGGSTEAAQLAAQRARSIGTVQCTLLARCVGLVQSVVGLEAFRQSIVIEPWWLKAVEQPRAVIAFALMELLMSKCAQPLITGSRCGVVPPLTPHPHQPPPHPHHPALPLYLPVPQGIAADVSLWCFGKDLRYMAGLFCAFGNSSLRGQFIFYIYY